MQSGRFTRIEPAFYDAALDPGLWSVALQLLADAADAAGAALIVRDNRTGHVEWAHFVGPTAGLAADYVDYYSTRDPYAAILLGSPPNRLIRISEAIPGNQLRTNEWYNDFLLKCGIGDAVGSRIHVNGSYTVLLGVLEGVGRAPLAPETEARLTRLLKPLGRAAALQQRLIEHGWRSTIALRSLDQMSAGVIVSDGDGTVIEMNIVAERFIRQDDGLSLRHGKLRAGRAFETAKLSALLSAATATTASGRIAVGRPDSRPPYLLTVAPLGPRHGDYGRPLALTLIVDPDSRLPTYAPLAELFGLSPAESRLAIALLSGKTLRNTAKDLGVEIPTLRTQLSSVFRKVGVRRQVDMIRILAGIPAGLSAPAATPRELPPDSETRLRTELRATARYRTSARG